jgi:hypothetical protein
LIFLYKKKEKGLACIKVYPEADVLFYEKKLIIDLKSYLNYHILYSVWCAKINKIQNMHFKRIS